MKRVVLACWFFVSACVNGDESFSSGEKLASQDDCNSWANEMTTGKKNGVNLDCNIENNENNKKICKDVVKDRFINLKSKRRVRENICPLFIKIMTSHCRSNCGKVESGLMDKFFIPMCTNKELVNCVAWKDYLKIKIEEYLINETKNTDKTKNLGSLTTSITTENLLTMCVSAIGRFFSFTDGRKRDELCSSFSKKQISSYSLSTLNKHLFDNFTQECFFKFSKDNAISDGLLEAVREASRQQDK